MVYNGVNGIWYTQNMCWWLVVVWWLNAVCGEGVRGSGAPYWSEICGCGLCGLRLKTCLLFRFVRLYSAGAPPPRWPLAAGQAHAVSGGGGGVLCVIIAANTRRPPGLWGVSVSRGL